MPFRKLSVLILSVLLLSGCASTDRPGALKHTPASGNPNLAWLDKGRMSNTMRPVIERGMSALSKGDLSVASESFNRALKFDPTNPSLHFLNALTYHLMADGGDTSRTKLAEAGYRMALNFDRSNHWAFYQLGNIMFKQRRYGEAQDYYAAAVIVDDQKVDFLLALTSASYYTQDLETALTAIKDAERLAFNNRPGSKSLRGDFMKAAAFIHAAAGLGDKARAYLVRYNTLDEVDERAKARLAERIDDWNKFYRKAPKMMRAADMTDTSDILGSSETTEGLGDDDSDGGDNDDSSDDSTSDSKTKAGRMTIVDVVIIRSEERVSTGKGVNLLAGLQATIGGDIINWSAFTGKNASGDLPFEGRTYNFKLTLGTSASQVEYLLNIFNDSFDRSELIAQPSLLALDGTPSEFFSGAVWHVELAGVAGGESSVESIPVGVRIKVTPTFLDDETLKLDVEAGRAMVSGLSPEPTFNNFAETSKTTVTASVALKFGETVVLSGLTVREDEKIRNGVPFLQNIPVVQYLFSREDTVDYKKSVLIMITPRRARTRDVATANKGKDWRKPNLAELKKDPRWMEVKPALDYAYLALSEGRLYNQFRSGDLSALDWKRTDTVGKMIERAATFLYY